MVTALTGLAAVVGDFGLSLAALQAPHLSHAQKSNLFWLNSALGLGIGGVVAASSVAVAAFYHQPQLVQITLALAVVFALNGVAVQYSVELNRAGRLGALGLWEFVAQAGGLVIGLALAVLNFGYWALVLQQIGTSLLLLLFVIAAAHWTPMRPSRGTELRRLVTFGRDTFGVQVANYVTSNLDSALIGRQFASSVLGLYNRAFQIVMLPIQQIVAPLTRVFLPRLSRLDDDHAFNALLQRLQLLLSYAMFGPLSLLAATATPLLSVLLGDRWSAAGALIQVLAVGSAFQSAGFVYYWAFLARSRTSLLLLSELWGRLVMVVMMLTLVRFGPVWVAVSVDVGQFLIWLAATVYYGRRANVRASGLLRAAGRPGIVFLCAFGGSFAASHLLVPNSGAVVSLAIGVAGWLATLVVAILVLPAIRTDLRQVVAVIRPAQGSV